MPEAKTSSERLKMAGKAVTVDSLKEIVENADVRGAAHRANTTIAGPINTLFRLILKLIGLVFIFFGLSIVFGLVTGVTYFLSRGNTWLQYNIFPVGLQRKLTAHYHYGGNRPDSGLCHTIRHCYIPA